MAFHWQKKFRKLPKIFSDKFLAGVYYIVHDRQDIVPKRLAGLAGTPQ
jgi:hypothetical protein